MVYHDADGDPLRYLISIDGRDYDLEFDLESEIEVAVVPRRIECCYKLSLVAGDGSLLGERLETITTTTAANPFHDVAVWKSWDEWHEYAAKWLRETATNDSQ